MQRSGWRPALRSAHEPDVRRRRDKNAGVRDSGYPRPPSATRRARGSDEFLALRGIDAYQSVQEARPRSSGPTGAGNHLARWLQQLGPEPRLVRGQRIRGAPVRYTCQVGHAPGAEAEQTRQALQRGLSCPCFKLMRTATTTKPFRPHSGASRTSAARRTRSIFSRTAIRAPSPQRGKMAARGDRADFNGSHNHAALRVHGPRRTGRAPPPARPRR